MSSVKFDPGLNRIDTRTRCVSTRDRQQIDSLTSGEICVASAIALAICAGSRARRAEGRCARRQLNTSCSRNATVHAIRVSIAFVDGGVRKIDLRGVEAVVGIDGGHLDHAADA